MKDDFTLISWKLDRGFEKINLYPLGDVHRGNKMFSETLWNRWKNMVMNDPFGYVVICGDIFEMNLKNSKGNSYENRSRTPDDKRWLASELKPFKDRILGGTMGNHEYRGVYATDDCPLYDVMCKLDIEDLYRENMAFIKVSLGQRGMDRQVTYTIVVGHGVSSKKTETFGYAIDGMDIFITGHTHMPTSNHPAKIVIDPHNDIVKLVGYKHVVVPSFLDMGGYVLKGMYMPHDNNVIPILSLSGREKKIEVTWK